MSASKNIFWLSLSRVCALALLFFAYTQLFRYLGPSGTGQHQFVLSYITIFGVVVDFGIQQYIIKKISETPGQAKHFFQQFFAVEVCLATLVYVMLAAVASFMRLESAVYYAILWSGFGMCLSALTHPYLAVLTAFGDLKKVALLNFVSSLINVIIITLTVVLHKDIVFLVSNQLIYAVVALTFYQYFVKKYIPDITFFGFRKSLHFGDIRLIAKAALPFAMLVGFSTIYNRIDVILIKHFLDYEKAGYYTAAYKMFDLLAFLPAAVSHTLYPIFARSMSRGAVGAVKNTLEKYIRFMLFVALPVGVAGTVLSRQMMILLAGEKFIEASPVLAILIWASSALYIYVVAHSIMVSQLTKLAVVATVINMVVNISGNLIFLPIYGIKAAATFTVISEVLQGILYFYFVKSRVTDFRFWTFSWRPVLAAGVMGAALWPVRDMSLYISVVIGGVVYLLSMLMFGFFKKSDIAFIMGFMRSTK